MFSSEAIKKTRLLTNKSFAINIFIPNAHTATDEKIDKARQAVQSVCAELNIEIPTISPPYVSSFDEQMRVIVDEKIPIVSFTFGVLPEHWIKILKNNKVIIIGTATTLEEAKILKENGIDAVVAQGSEAGGHRGTFIGKAENYLVPVKSLVSLIAENINIPVIAAGGIMQAHQIVDLLKQGASAVQMGTAFLCCDESGAPAAYKKILLSALQDNTTLMRAFSGKLARGINNLFIERMQKYKNTILDYSVQHALTISMRKETAKQGRGGIISQLQDRNQVEELAKKDPFYIHGVADFEIIEFTPTKYHTDLSVLMKG